MLEGLQILIARMETNPDEFLDGKWDYFTDIKDETWTIFTKEEVEALKDAKEKLEATKLQRRRDRYTEMIIERLMQDTLSTGYATPMKTQQMQQILEKGINEVFKKEYANWTYKREEIK